MEELNRAFMYGESVFTTLRMIDGQLKDWELHFDRLKRGVAYVYGPFVEGEDWAGQVRSRLETGCSHEAGDKIIRLSVYRSKARGMARTGVSSVADLKINIWATPLDISTEEKTIRLRSCAKVQRPYWWPSYLKAGSYLETILSQKMHLKEGDDDLLFLSPEDTLLESSVANIFVVKHGRLYTAPVGPNVLAGIMRQKVLEVARDFFDDVLEVETTMEQALKADALFGTNSVRGPFLIEAIDDYDFPLEQSFRATFSALRERVMA